MLVHLTGSSDLNKIFVILFVAFCSNIFAGEANLKNVIIISVDTLRADHLSCYGYPIKTSPAIDDLSRDGVRFSRCFTITPLTSPGFSTMLTSLPPYKHGSKRNGLPIFKHIRTLPYFLKKYNYCSSAFISNWPLRKNLSGLHRDFDSYYEVFNKKRWFGLLNSEGKAKEVTKRAIKWLENHHKKRIFLWVHLSEPHAPYVSHKKFDFDIKKIDLSYYPPGTRFSKIKKYDSEIAFTDFYIGKLIEKIKELGLYHDSLIVFNSDHGESFGEHNYFKHGRKLYDSCLHVPLIIKLPGNRLKNSTQNENVSILDLSPTILSILKLQIPEYMEGSALFDKRVKLREAIYFEAYRGAVITKRSTKFHIKVYPKKFGILQGSIKLIYTCRKETIEAYSIKDDRFELRDLYMENPKEYHNLKILLMNRIKKVEKYIQHSKKYFKKRSNLSKEDIEKLKTLGYIH